MRADRVSMPSGRWNGAYARATALAVAAAIVVLLLLLPKSVNPLRAESGPPAARTKLTVAPLVVSTTPSTIAPGALVRAKIALGSTSSAPVITDAPTSAPPGTPLVLVEEYEAPATVAETSPPATDPPATEPPATAPPPVTEAPTTAAPAPAAAPATTAKPAPATTAKPPATTKPQITVPTITITVPTRNDNSGKGNNDNKGKKDD